MMSSQPPITTIPEEASQEIYPASFFDVKNPTVGMLSTVDYRVDGRTIANEVDKVLRNLPKLPGVIIQNQQQVVGVISRRNFYEILGRRYGVAIYLNRPVEAMLEFIEAKIAVVPATKSIPDTVTMALKRPLDQIYEPILVEFSAEDHRLLDVYTLLLAQTQIFENLQRELRAINEELEQRVAKRTAELLAANENLQYEIGVRRSAESRLEIRLAYEQALTQCANVLLTGGDTQGVIRETLTYLQQIVGASRVFMADHLNLNGQGPGFRLRRQICAPGIAPIPEQFGILPDQNLGSWISRLWSGRWIIGHGPETSYNERKLMHDLGFVSILLLPIGEPRNWVGIIGFGETENPRDWDESDIQLLQAVAQMLYAYLERRHNAEVLAAARDEALRASQFKSELLAKVSHELRTPLGAILGYAQLLSLGSYGAITDGQKEATELVISSSKYLNSLVNGLLDQAQIESGQMKLREADFDVREMVTAIETRMRVLALNKNLDFKTELAPEIPTTFTGDRMRIEQVLINLLGNAIKFTGQGSVRLRVCAPGQQILRFEIIDTGPGIAENEQRRIFEPFAQVDGSPASRFDGTGLGLSISKQLVEMMDGHISLHSQPGTGTTFIVELPLEKSVKEPLTPGQPEEQPISRPQIRLERILT